MSFSRSFVASLLVCCFLLVVSVPSFAEYDVLTRYAVDRPEGGRHFWLYTPTNYSLTNNSLPLIFFFHGYTDQCELQGYVSQFSIWAYVAEVHQYHIAVMCGTNPGPGWNSGGDPTRVDDIAYTRASLALIKSNVNVRDGHVFAMGHSNGAMMSEFRRQVTGTTLPACVVPTLRPASHPSRMLRLCALLCFFFVVLGCWLVMRLISSTPSLPTPGTTQGGPSINASLAYCTAGYGNNHTSILKIHGTADQAVIYNGTANFPGAVADTYAWAGRNGCKGDAQPQWTHGIASAQGWRQCNGGVEVELVSLWGVNHQVRKTNNAHHTTLVQHVRSTV